MIALATAPLVDSSDLRSDPEALRLRARRDGYLWMRGVVDAAALDALRIVVVACCSRLGWLATETGGDPVACSERRGVRTNDATWIDLQVAVLSSPELARIREDAGATAIVRALLGGEIAAAQGDVCRVVFPDSDELTTPPHQDGAYVGTDRECWTVWIPLGDCPLDRGPLAVLPGSHRGGLRKHAGESGATDSPAEGWAASALAAGDALFFHALTLHGALPNRSAGLLRLSVDLRYRAAVDGRPATQ
jgi:ectoine hydroxylase-related dioxygenase (phytanoyl-CoA dioxygenase family)